MLQSKANNTNQAVKAGIWYTICNFLARGLAFLTTPIFSRLLGTADYGNYNNFTSWLSILTIVATMDMFSTIARARFDYSEEYDGYISSITLLGTIITGAIYLVVVIFMPFFSALFSMDPFYIHVLFLNLLVAPSFQMLQTKNRMDYKYKLFVVLTILLSVSTITTSLVLVSTMQDKLMGRVLGQILPTFLIDLIIYIYLIWKGRCFKIEHCKYVLHVCLPYVPHLLALNLLGTSDRIMIKRFCGNSDAGIYSLAYTCSLCLNLLCTSLNQAMTPWLSSQLHINNLKRIRSVSQKYLIIFCIFSILISFWGPELIFIFGGRAYMEAVKIMPPVFIGLLFQFAYTMHVNIEMYDRKVGGVAIGTVSAASINIILNIIFIPIFGYVAAAYTTLVGYVLLFIIHFCLVRRIGRGNVYNNKNMISTLIVTALIMVGTSMLYSLYLIRYFIFAGLAITVFIVFKKQGFSLDLKENITG